MGRQRASWSLVAAGKCGESFRFHATILDVKRGQKEHEAWFAGGGPVPERLEVQLACRASCFPDLPHCGRSGDCLISQFALHIRSPYCLPASRCWGRKGAGTFALWEVFLVQAICHPGLVISVTYFANSQFFDSEVTLSMI